MTCRLRIHEKISKQQYGSRPLLLLLDVYFESADAEV